MTTTNSADVSLNEFLQFIDSINNVIADGVTNFIGQVGTGLLTEAERLERLGNFFSDQFSTYALSARSPPAFSTEHLEHGWRQELLPTQTPNSVVKSCAIACM
jgi:hypothetical protein